MTNSSKFADALYGGPKAYASSFKATLSPFKENTDLSNMLRAFVNEATPCHLTQNKEGQTVDKLIHEYFESIDYAITTYTGPFTNSSQEIIVMMLLRNGFNLDVQDGHYDQVGVACNCDAGWGIGCTFVFAKNPILKSGVSVPSAEFSNLTYQWEC